MDYSSIELHDATLQGLSVNFPQRELSLEVAYYPQGNASSQRVPATITFSGVARLNKVLDLTELALNAGAGNISYWNPAAGPGYTYIYLASGIIAVEAASISFTARA